MFEPKALDQQVLKLRDPGSLLWSSHSSVLTHSVTARGDYRVELVRIDLHRIWMHRGDESLARVLNYTPSGKRATLLFGTDQSQPAMPRR
jgi:hypothetical protein